MRPLRAGPLPRLRPDAYLSVRVREPQEAIPMNRHYFEADIVLRTYCPVCARLLFILKSRRRTSPRSRVRKMVQGHIARAHPGISTRYVSLLADSVAEALFG